MDKIKYYREKIDAIDKNITKLLVSRFSWVKRIVHYIANHKNL